MGFFRVTSRHWGAVMPHAEAPRRAAPDLIIIEEKRYLLLGRCTSAGDKAPVPVSPFFYLKDFNLRADGVRYAPGPYFHTIHIPRYRQKTLTYL